MQYFQMLCEYMRDERNLLLDIADAADLISSYVDGVSEEEFLENSMLQNAVTYNFAIIGEASSRLTDETKGKYPEIEWQSMTSFRNVIVHAYFSLDLEIVWGAATKKVTPLSERLRDIVHFDFPETDK